MHAVCFKFYLEWFNPSSGGHVSLWTPPRLGKVIKFGQIMCFLHLPPFYIFKWNCKSYHCHNIIIYHQHLIISKIFLEQKKRNMANYDCNPLHRFSSSASSLEWAISVSPSTAPSTSSSTSRWSRSSRTCHRGDPWSFSAQTFFLLWNKRKCLKKITISLNGIQLHPFEVTGFVSESYNKACMRINITVKHTAAGERKRSSWKV